MNQGDCTIHISLAGRCKLQDKEEASCILDTVRGEKLQLITISVEGFEGSRSIVMYLDFIGRVEGDAVWLGAGRVNVNLRASPEKIQRLQRQFALVA